MNHYKLTTQQLTTHNGFQWIVGKWEHALGDGKLLCSDGWIHCYDDPLIAVFMNPIHANITNPRLWLIEVQGQEQDDNGLKRGVKEARLVEELPLPVVTIEQRVETGIRYSLLVYRKPYYVTWAESWLSNKDRKDRSAQAAWSTACKAAAAAESAKWSESATACKAAWAAGSDYSTFNLLMIIQDVLKGMFK